MLMRRGMKRIITPAVFLSASILAGCAQDAAPATPGTDELAGESAQDGETPEADAAHDNFGFVAVEKSGAFQCNNVLTCVSYELSRGAPGREKWSRPSSAGLPY